MLVAATAPPAAPWLRAVADYAVGYDAASEHAYAAAFDTVVDAIACALQALKLPACTRLLGPVVPGATMARGARVPGTSYELDPVKAAFDIGTLVRWFGPQHAQPAAGLGNDDDAGRVALPRVASPMAHPADSLGALLSVADYLSRRAIAQADAPPSVRDLLRALIKAGEIQGALAVGNGFERGALDPAVPVRVASAAMATVLLGGRHEQVIAAVSNAWVDGSSLRAYAQGSFAAARARWATGDATSRGLRLALLAMAGDPGCPTVMSQPTGGSSDESVHGPPMRLERALGCSVMEQAMDDGAARASLQQRFESCVLAHFSTVQADRIKALFADRAKLEPLPVHDLVALLVRN